MIVHVCMTLYTETVDCTQNMTIFYLHTIIEDIQKRMLRFNKFNQSKVKYITSPQNQ